MSNHKRKTDEHDIAIHKKVALQKKHVDLIISNATQVATVRGHSGTPAVGAQMDQPGIIENASIAVLDDKIISVGKSDEILPRYEPEDYIDATGKVVTPGFIDAHTHFVFAGSRENELEMKTKGSGYMEILQSGGGILSTVRDTRAASEDELLTIGKRRGMCLLKHGVTTIEGKSGYGLTLPDEIKILEVMKRLNTETPLTVIPTFLGAHALPPEFSGRKSDYVRTICEEWIPEIQKRQLARFCDVFCEKDVFELSDSRKILEAGKKFGLLPKIHADELYALGGTELAAEIAAVTADHLLQASPAGLTKLKTAGTIAVLSPATPLTLMTEKYANARGMIQQSIPIALGSDLNPSCWIENHQLIIALACYKLRMTPAEALVAATINAAHSIRMAHTIGSIEPGKKADLLILDVKDYRSLANRFGSNLVDTVVKNGRVEVRQDNLLTPTSES